MAANTYFRFVEILFFRLFAFLYLLFKRKTYTLMLRVLCDSLFYLLFNYFIIFLSYVYYFNLISYELSVNLFIVIYDFFEDNVAGI